MTEPTRWELAYQRLDTPEQERQKFLRRFRSLGVERWNRQAGVLEVCSGRGNGMIAWRDLGFTDVCGVDLSQALIEVSPMRNACIVGDARRLPILTASRDIAIVQGGLHHLPTFADVMAGLREMRRVLKPEGHVILIEPWLTPFLRLVHFISEQPVARALWDRLDAFATLAEEERPLYQSWLAQPARIMAAITDEFDPIWIRIRWGKLMFVGRPRSGSRSA